MNEKEIKQRIEEGLAGLPRHTITTSRFTLHAVHDEPAPQDSAHLLTHHIALPANFARDGVVAWVHPDGVSFPFAVLLGVYECITLFTMARLRLAGRLPAHLQADCDAVSELVLQFRLRDCKDAPLREKAMAAVRKALLALQEHEAETARLRIGMVELIRATEKMPTICVALEVFADSPSGERAREMGGWPMYAELGPFENIVQFDACDQPYVIGEVRIGATPPRKLRFGAEAAYELLEKLVFDQFKSNGLVPMADKRTRAALHNFDLQADRIIFRDSTIEQRGVALGLEALDTLRTIDHTKVRYPAIVTLEAAAQPAAEVSPQTDNPPQDYCVAYVVEVGTCLRIA